MISTTVLLTEIAKLTPIDWNAADADAQRQERDATLQRMESQWFVWLCEEYKNTLSIPSASAIFEAAKSQLEDQGSLFDVEDRFAELLIVCRYVVEQEENAKTVDW